MAKKSFKDNPALHFITRPGAAAKPKPDPAAGSAPVKLNPLYVETKSKRVQLLMQPSLHARLKDLAAGHGRSFNDLVHEVLSGWTEKEDQPG